MTETPPVPAATPADAQVAPSPVASAAPSTPPAMTSSATDPAFARLLELVGRRWTLRLIWELRGGPLAFNELRKRVGGMSQSVLVTRLTELFGAGLVEDVSGGYTLTQHGVELAGELARLDAFAASWARES